MVNYVLVKFLETGEGDVCPLNWLDKSEQKAFWPSEKMTPSQVIKLIKKGDKPAKSFKLYKIKLMSTKRYTSYRQAEIDLSSKMEALNKLASETDDDSLAIKRSTMPNVESPECISLDTPFGPPPQTSKSGSRSANNDDSHISIDDCSRESNREEEMDGDSEHETDRDCQSDENEKNEEDNKSTTGETPANSNSNSNQRDDELMAKIQDTVKLQIDSLKNFLIQEMLSQKKPETCYDYQNVEELMPLDTEGKLIKFDQTLAKDQDFADKTVKWFKSNGGSDEKSIAARCLKRLLTYEVAKDFSFEGRKQKKAFNALELVTVLKRAAKERLRDYNDEEFDNAIVNFLKRAPELAVLDEEDQPAEKRPKKGRRVQRKMPFYLDPRYKKGTKGAPEPNLSAENTKETKEAPEPNLSAENTKETKEAPEPNLSAENTKETKEASKLQGDVSDVSFIEGNIPV